MEKRLSAMQKNMIDERAEKVLLAYQYKDGEDIYVDAILLARLFGFNVAESNSLVATEDGCITVSEDASERNILINDNRSFETKRFIITHELAHYLLHYQGSGRFFKHREDIKGKNLEENDADYLAACLLMPRKSFKKQYEDLSKLKGCVDIIAELQRKFRTPRESIERRIQEVCR